MKYNFALYRGRRNYLKYNKGRKGDKKRRKGVKKQGKIEMVIIKRMRMRYSKRYEMHWYSPFSLLLSHYGFQGYLINIHGFLTMFHTLYSITFCALFTYKLMEREYKEGLEDLILNTSLHCCGLYHGRLLDRRACNPRLWKSCKVERNKGEG